MTSSLSRVLALAVIAAAACRPDDRTGVPAAPAGPPIDASPALRTVANGPRPALLPTRPDRPFGTGEGPTTVREGAGLYANSTTSASDVVWQQVGTGNFGIWYMNGTAPISGAENGWTPFAVSPGWRVEASGDFDGDGSTDLLFHQVGTGHFGIWFMNEGLLHDPGIGWHSLEASPDWEVADAADFDVDGKLDLLWRNPTTGGNGIWLMNGTTPKPEPGGWVGLNASPGWHVDVAGDFDVDGYADIVWHQTGTGNFGVWRMTATAPAVGLGAWNAFAASTGWEVIDATDYVGDIRPDLVFRKNTNDQAGIWRMSGMLPSTATNAWTSLGGSSGWVPVSGADFGIGTNYTYTAIGTGANAAHQCAVRSDGRVMCWGSNTYGQIGDGTTTTRYTPTGVGGAGVSGATAVAQGAQHTCALISAAAYCWGRNDYGQLGNATNNTAGNTSANGTPLAVTVPAAVTTGYRLITAGSQHTCAVAGPGTPSGSLYCWGSNTSGQLGTTALNGSGASTNGERTPTLVAFPGGVTTVKSVAAGAGHTCAIGSDDQLYCWGTNYAGQLGAVTTNAAGNAVTPQLVPLPSGVGSWSAVAAGWAHTCAIAATGTNAGRVYCWGLNSYGQIGTTGSGGSSPVAVALPSATTFSVVTAGDEHTCAIANSGATSGRLYCWGFNYEGELGSTTNAGFFVANPTPLLVPAPTGAPTFVGVGAGTRRTCAITGTTGWLRCWGL